jgi:hypothetical protein
MLKVNCYNSEERLPVYEVEELSLEEALRVIASDRQRASLRTVPGRPSDAPAETVRQMYGMLTA